MSYFRQPNRQPLDAQKAELESTSYPYDSEGRALLKILNCQVFDAYLYLEPQTEAGLSFQTLPTDDVFEEVYIFYCTSKESGCETAPLLSRTSSRTTPEYDTFTYNGHKAAWRLFECIVYMRGPSFSLTKETDLRDLHRTLNWVDIAREMGRPFAIDPKFPLYLRKHYFDHVAPIVNLWFLTLYPLIQSQMVSRGVSDRETLFNPNDPLSAISILKNSTRTLGLKLLPIITLTDEDFNYADDTLEPVQGFLLAVALKQELRGVARHLSSHLAELLMRMIQWYLDNYTGSPKERAMVIKLFQDSVNCSGIFPKDMIHKGFVADSGNAIQGSEARVQKGRIGSGRQAVALRIPNDPDNGLVVRWNVQKRYTRGLIILRQIQHDSIVKFLGIHEYGTGTYKRLSVAMEWMDGPVRKHRVETSVGKWGSYAHLSKGVLSGLKYLHANQVVHGDFHWGNVLVDNKGSPKIADFGYSRIHHHDGNSLSTSVYSSELFMPNEIMKNQKRKRQERERPGYTTDVYSCGILLLALALPARPMTPENKKEKLHALADKISQNGLGSCVQPQYLAGLPSGKARSLWDLIGKMTAVEKEDRPDIGEVSQKLDDLFLARIS